MAKNRKNLNLQLDDPLKFEDHGRPVTRRQFIRQGFATGSATLLSGGIFSLFANPNAARAAVSADLNTLAGDIGCTLGGLGAGQSVPFICFDLAGGANFAGSNVLVGQQGPLGQMELLSTAGYNKLGLPGDMLPGQNDTAVAASLLNPSNGDFVNTELNLAFHADSPLLRGIREKATTAIGNIDGCVVPARSDNDTGNNPHNPLYALAMTGARGSVVDLVGSRSSDSGGNSMSPAMYIDPEFRPTKVDRPSDVTGLVDVGDLTSILGANDVTAVMESIARVSHKKMKLGTIDTGLSNNDIIKDLVRCGYLKAADIAERFAGQNVDPTQDLTILSIFSAAELAGDSEFRKTASVMKMVMEGYAAGGCITMGGYDYHTGDRVTGENRDLRAGRCIGACLEYARRYNNGTGKPLMVYVFSDGSVFSNGNIDDAVARVDNGIVVQQAGSGGKGEWTGDNSSTACSFFLVFDPTGQPAPFNNGLPIEAHRQIGHMNAGASVVTSATPMANNVNLLVNMVMLNYMALNGDVTPGNASAFTSIFPNHGLGNQAALDSFIAFGAL